jgi:hypothetical protein
MMSEQTGTVGGGQARIVLEIFGWSVVVAAAAWLVTLLWATAAMARSRQAMQDEIDHWHAEAVCARQLVSQLRHEAATWSRGRQDGRDELMAMMPLLVAAQQGLAGPGAPDGADVER